MSTITFRHGPVTITVEGLPESVLLDSVKLELGVHSAYHKRNASEAFVENFGALGGTATFPATRADEQFSVRSYARGIDPAGIKSGAESKLVLYPPHADVAPARWAAIPEIAAALQRESIEQTADGAAATLREAGS